MPAQMHRHHFWEPTHIPAEIKAKYDKLLPASGFQVLNFMEHHFSPQGYTAIWLLAESHLAVHTFPEDGRTYVELTSCHAGKQAQFIQLLNQQDLNPHLA